MSHLLCRLLQINEEEEASLLWNGKKGGHSMPALQITLFTRTHVWDRTTKSHLSALCYATVDSDLHLCPIVLIVREKNNCWYTHDLYTHLDTHTRGCLGSIQGLHKCANSVPCSTFFTALDNMEKVDVTEMWVNGVRQKLSFRSACLGGVSNYNTSNVTVTKSVLHWQALKNCYLLSLCSLTVVWD